MNRGRDQSLCRQGFSLMFARATRERVQLAEHGFGDVAVSRAPPREAVQIMP
ncbi:MAG: hypothetical protein HC933_14025 [Pleurocapsa sp. SU_196_0]|nr:hypothetical protein [Pleurocapsa sp. SU_196_0]